MVDYRTWMSIGLSQCTDASMDPERRKQVFAQLAEGWNSEKDTIQDLTESEVRERIECP